MKAKHLISILFLSFAGSGLAQQLPLFSIYRDNWGVLNPASISSNYLINELNYSVGATYRRQWFKVNDSPNTQLVNAEIIPKSYDRIVTGGHIIRDQTGLISNTGIYGRFGYQLEFSGRAKQSLVLGLGVGVVQYRARIDQIDFAEDEIGPLENDKIVYPDFSFGAFYYYDDVFYAGISVPQLFGLTTDYKNIDGEAFGIKRLQHFYAVAGGYISVSWFGAEASFVEPSIWFRYVPNSPLSFDLNMRYQVSDFFWAGTGAGIGLGEDVSSTLHLETGVILGETVQIQNGQIKIGIGFDIPFSSYKSFFGNTIEINAIYSWF